ncbi:GGDEF domain-containing response regulator [Catenovulum sediminis]|uniref:diguanylate cyclase n=1 Tax=Catenovulum sediminis TaxID=1740262 RepID=A0ABV1RKN6_9ALTE|nr:diguanylate cyclase [Catenovulum sediminis]
MNQNNKGLSILIVDDDKTNRRILKELVEGMAVVLLAKNGAQAIEKSTELKPDLIILDIVMPDMDGFAVIDTLKNNRETHDIPIIFITANNCFEMEEKGLRLGAVDFIAKPFHGGVVQARVNTHLQSVAHKKLLDQLAHIDALTTIANRRQFDEVLHKEWQYAYRNRTEFTLAVVDIDYFKSYNDTYGHLVGDKALRSVALALQSQLVRPRDFVGRLGGEEFVIVLPETDVRGAEVSLHNCLNAVRELDIPHENSQCEACVTVSIGSYTCIPENMTDMLNALNFADQSLYLAKDNGRNQLYSQNYKQDSKLVLLNAN